LVRLGQLLAVLPVWQIIGRHTPKTATAPGSLAPNVHTVFGRVNWLYQQFLEGGSLNTQLDLILKEASDDPTVPIVLDPAAAKAVADVIAEQLKTRFSVTMELEDPDVDVEPVPPAPPGS
jgi:hypothetical protein